MKSQGYMHALAGLQFFCFPGSVQVESWRTNYRVTTNFFFPEKNETDCGCEYFFGVACVFITYAGALYDTFLSTDEIEHLPEFHRRLNDHMLKPAKDWSEVSVIESKNWERLRECAKMAIDELHESLPSQPQVFDIEALISPTEFRTSDEAKRLLE